MLELGAFTSSIDKLTCRSLPGRLDNGTGIGTIHRSPKKSRHVTNHALATALVSQTWATDIIAEDTLRALHERSLNLFVSHTIRIDSTSV